jgi:hypothetical protein
VLSTMRYIPETAGRSWAIADLSPLRLPSQKEGEGRERSELTSHRNSPVVSMALIT